MFTYLNLLFKDQLRFDISKGIIRYKSTTKKSQIDLKAPLVTCDAIYSGILKPINIFLKQTNRFNANKDLIKISKDLNKRNTLASDPTTSTKSIYIGKYNSQYYAQYINDNLFNDQLNNNKELFFNQFDNNKQILSKTKSTILPSTIFNNNYFEDLYKQQQKQSEQSSSNSLIPVNNQIIKPSNEHSNEINSDDDDDTNDYDLLVPNDLGGWFFIEQQILNKNLNHYIDMKFTYKQFYTMLFTLVAIIFSVIFAIRQ